MRCLVALVLVGCAASPAKPASPSLVGTWVRDSIVVTEKVSFPIPEQIVTYVQTPHSFGDVRVVRGRPVVDSLADVTDEGIEILAKQSGFVGVNTVAGTRSTWTHEIDYVAGGGDDIGDLAPRGLLLEERGLDDKGAVDNAAFEKWWQLDNGNGHCYVAREIVGDRVRRMLVVAGDHFVYARARAVDLPQGVSLRKFVAGDASRDQKLAALDCELSFGFVRLGSVPWEVKYSTLPWKEGVSVEALPEKSWVVEVDTFTPEEHALIFAGAPRK